MQRLGSRSTDFSGFSDAELVRLALQREGEAFRAIMQRHNRRLYRVARSVVHDDSEAEDVVQEAYVLAFTNLAKFRAESALLLGSRASRSTRRWAACGGGGRRSTCRRLICRQAMELR